MGTIADPTHEQNVGKFDTYAPSENWHTQKWERLVHPALQDEQNVQDKVSPINFIIKLIAFSSPSKRPKTIPKSLTQMIGCASNFKG
jgi:hypothetical protein